MYQTTIKIVQAVIFIGITVLLLHAGQSDPSLKGMNGSAAMLVALLVVVLFTVVPWLIFMMIKNVIADVRLRMSSHRPSKPTRIEPVFTELPDNPVSGSRISRDSRPRIGK